MANDDFFEGLDQAEAEQGKKILEAKQQKRVRYWYEEGYVPGNEQDSDEEENNDGKQGEEDEEEQSDSDSASSTGYEEVRITLGGARGGRRATWGGLSGRLAIQDAPPGTVAKLDEVLDELLLPGADTGGSARSDAGLSEVTAIVLAQLPQEGRCWSYSSSSCLAIEDDKLEEEYEAARLRYAIEDGEENTRVRSEEEQSMASWAKYNTAMQRQAREDLVAQLKEEEKKKRSIQRGAREQLPGTRKPLPLSQAWQERKAETGGRKLEAPKPSGRSMLPCSLSGSSSSSRSEGHAVAPEEKLGIGQSEKWLVRKPIMQREKHLLPTRPLPKRMPDSVLRPVVDDGPQPEFRVPQMVIPKHRPEG
mmetsp:Transcript_92168/g.298422  ORF Transcript_92168/g.298422 Transcript_92168/m.298422 type:complete len:363 (+) Transcript_92168:108-1196(+)